MTISQLRRILKIVGDVLAQVGPIILAIADVLPRHGSKRKPPQ